MKGIRGEVLVHALEEKQIYISTTSACSSRKKWLAALICHACARELATSAVRISLDESNTMAEIEQFMIVFNQLYQKFSRVINKNKLEPRNRLQLIFALFID